MRLLQQMLRGFPPPPRRVGDSAAELGENPVWSASEQALYWIDIAGRALYRSAPAARSTRTWPLAAEPQALVLDSDGAPLLALDGRLCRFDAATGTAAEVARLPDLVPGARFNDGSCDVAGRLWIGSMDRDGARPLGVLYCLGRDGSVRRIDDGYTISNGPAFAGAGRRLYIADSPKRLIYAVDLDDGDGVAGKRVFARFAAADGYPDGMTVDAEDHLWVAHYDGWRVTRFDPSGAAVRTIRLPVARVTSCAFGDSDLRTLYITTARAGLEPAALRRQRQAGGLFAVRTDVAGRPAHRFDAGPAAAMP